jgi:dolichyl-phosphate-mannose-protein mannosyltransferase
MKSKASYKTFFQGKQKILVIILLALALRIVLSFFGTLKLDFNTFVAWSVRLNKVGFAEFYRSWSDYLPGYLYILWLLAKIQDFLPSFPQTLLYKLPAILADIGTGYLICLIVKKYKNKKWAYIASSLYLFNPAVLANSTLWGQVDSLTSFLSILSIYILSINPVLSSIILAFAATVKVQASLASVVILFLMIKNKWKLERISIYVFLSFFTFIIAFVPFANNQNVFTFVYERITTTLNQYPYTSVNAFNLWGFFGFWQQDEGIISASFLGILITLILLIWALKQVWEKKGAEYHLLSFLFVTNFMFFGRMHERHFLPALAPLTISASLIPSIWLVYLVFSSTYLANLYYSYVWITRDFKEVFSETFVKIFIVLNIGGFILLYKNLLSQAKEQFSFGSFNNLFNRDSKRKPKAAGKTESFPKTNLSRASLRNLLIVILAFALLSRVFYLNKPEKEYFDEVYHAFTAKVMLHGDPKAWEWWNPHPEGFAYEWTHPPLAKEFMWASMIIFGENSFAWRIPAALFGVGIIYLVYLISKEIFRDELLALISAAFFALDGLALTMSRIGMNDTYMLFFVLLSIYLYFKDKYFFSSLAFGLAASSKWSAIWAVPIFLVSHFVLKKKIKLSYFWFFVIPPLVYITSYAPMFLTGHSFDIFIGVQKQMWWYHTQLKADHPFTSMWYTWPFLARPIWLYTSGLIKSKISNIYAMGNPVVFWFGFLSVFYSFSYAYYRKSKRLALMIFSYLVFFVPWAASPRIMFLYHYLPSVPFMAIVAGYVLRRNLKLVMPVFLLAFIVFIYFYPHWTGIPVTEAIDDSYHWFKTW